MPHPLSDKREILYLLESVRKTIKKHGIKKVTNALDDMNMCGVEDESYQEVVDIIIDVVCEHFNKQRFELMSKEKRGVVTLAMKICMVHIRFRVKISNKEVAHMFGGRVRQTAWMAMEDFKKKNRENKFDQEYFEHFDKIDKSIEIKLKQLKEQQQSNKEAE
jgi:chromosomal replication initiation ATPase DnaA